MHFMSYLGSQGRAQDIQKITPVVTNDLNYLVRHWQDSSFDLWEEVRGQHFYTLLAQWKALDLGSRILLGVPQDMRTTWALTRNQISLALKVHLSREQHIILPTLNVVDGWTTKHSNLDVAVILAFLHSTDDGDDMAKSLLSWFQNSANQLIQSFQVYSINRSSQFQGLAPAIGRYPEDVYDGVGMTYGNPWFIATQAIAEFSCRIGNKILGRAFLNRALFHSDGTGNLQEQFSRDTGFVRGAQDLTWSHASYLTAWRQCQD